MPLFRPVATALVYRPKCQAMKILPSWPGLFPKTSSQVPAFLPPALAHAFCSSSESEGLCFCMKASNSDRDLLRKGLLRFRRMIPSSGIIPI